MIICSFIVVLGLLNKMKPLSRGYRSQFAFPRRAGALPRFLSLACMATKHGAHGVANSCPYKTTKNFAQRIWYFMTVVSKEGEICF